MNVYPFPLLVALVTALVTLPFYLELSWLIGVGLFALVYVAMDLERQMRTNPTALASLLFITGCLQLILAPWLSQFYPYQDPASQIPASAIAGYMAYAVPLCLAMGLGLLAGRGFTPRGWRGGPAPLTVNLDPVTEGAVLRLFWATLGLMVVNPWLPLPGVLAFLVLLVGEIALVCPLLLLLGRRSYWWKLALLPLGWKAMGAIGSTSFHSFMLWFLMYLMLFWSIRYRGRGFKYVLLGGLVFVFIFQPAKTYFREQGSSGVQGFASVLWSYVTHPARAYDQDVLAKTLMRLNQGWIVHRVMVWVPQSEPYAGWRMLARQATGVLLPRFILPDKYQVGGVEFFEQYTGHHLYGGTSMGLGYAGEFYAAFGGPGGVLAGFVYSLMLGLALERLRRAAYANPLWWAWGPFIFLVAIKTEDTVGNAVNWAVKAFVVVLLVRYAFARLFRRRYQARQGRALAGSPLSPPGIPPGAAARVPPR